MSIFDSVASRRPMSSQFNLTHSRKFSFTPGRMYPVLCQEVVPGDVWNYDLKTLVRFQPMQAPIMHLVDLYAYPFFVPDRLLMDRGKFEIFITGGKNGDGKDAFGNTIQIPFANFWNGTSDATKINVSNLGVGKLADYLGVQFSTPTPTGGAGDIVKLSMLPFIAFWKIWNENFRDQNLHDDICDRFPGIFDATGDITAAIFNAGGAGLDFFSVPKVCWEKDMYTSALPFAQKGSPVETPLSGTASVTYKQPAEARRVSATGAQVAGDLKTAAWAAGTQSATIYNQQTEAVAIENIQSVNLTSGGFTINALRLAARLQEWLEKMARGGSRYAEQMRSQFGVTSSDARLQRPEMLGGGKIPVSISEVLQTSEEATTPQGNMAGHGIASGHVAGFNRYFEEHGKLIVLYFLRPKTTYQQGIPRMFTQRFDKLSWLWPSFAQLGEQEVRQDELYATLVPADNDDIFGYQQRYAEFKYIPSTVHGEFRTTLDHWHWGRIFASKPTLSKAFVECDPDDRIFNVIDTSDPLYAIVINHITCKRPLPYHGEPTL